MCASLPLPHLPGKFSSKVFFIFLKMAYLLNCIEHSFLSTASCDIFFQLLDVISSNVLSIYLAFSLILFKWYQSDFLNCAQTSWCHPTHLRRMPCWMFYVLTLFFSADLSTSHDWICMRMMTCRMLQVNMHLQGRSLMWTQARRGSYELHSNPQHIISCILKPSSWSSSDSLYDSC